MFAQPSRAAPAAFLLGAGGGVPEGMPVAAHRHHLVRVDRAERRLADTTQDRLGRRIVPVVDVIPVGPGELVPLTRNNMPSMRFWDPQ